MGKIRVACIGLGFGSNFVSVYQQHPNSVCAAVCRRDRGKLEEAAKRYQVEKIYTDYEALLRDPDIDAVHINTQVPDHGHMTIAALKAGKHVACTVPMAMSIDECRQIAELRDKTGLVYMMMETAVFTREFLFVRQMVKEGKVGKIQFLRGNHQQNKDTPYCVPFWFGLPPMYYATHAVAPLLCLARENCSYVRCQGSGRTKENFIPIHNSPFAIETAHLKVRNSDLVCEITRSMFDTIRQYKESFDVYGTKMSFEWEQIKGEGIVEFTDIEDARRFKVPDFGHLLPPEIAHLTSYDGKDAGAGHTSFLQGGGHGGSYPHMVHEFLSAIAENRDSLVDAQRAANWSMVGLCAHESAMNEGKRVNIPEFGFARGVGADWF